MRRVDGCRTAEQKAVTNWDDASCTMQKECRPHLIGIKNSALVSLNCSNLQDLLSRYFTHGAQLLAELIHQSLSFAGAHQAILGGSSFCAGSNLAFSGGDESAPVLAENACPLQVTLDGVELYDAVHWTVHIVHSETVAINNCNIWGDQLIPNSAGIVVDGSRRVYLGGNIISTADSAITVKTSSGAAHHIFLQEAPCASSEHRSLRT